MGDHRQEVDTGLAAAERDAPMTARGTIDVGRGGSDRARGPSRRPTRRRRARAARHCASGSSCRVSNARGRWRRGAAVATTCIEDEEPACRDDRVASRTGMSRVAYASTMSVPRPGRSKRRSRMTAPPRSAPSCDATTARMGPSDGGTAWNNHVRARPAPQRPAQQTRISWERAASSSRAARPGRA